MIRFLTTISCLALLSACGDGQPLFDVVDNDALIDESSGAGSEDGVGIGGNVTPPVGTEDPSRSSGIVRYEARNADGGGYAQGFVYNAADDSFYIDNLAFDGENTYQRGTVRSELGTYAVYDADSIVIDPLTGNPIGQLVPYRAVLGVSSNTFEGEGRTAFAFVRTGAFLGYGFGGYVYERNGGVVLPTIGQAGFNGGYAGLRVYDNRGGFDYVEGDIEIALDFEDFNANTAVKGRVFNRNFFDQNGVPVLDIQTPDLNFTITEGSSSLNSTGEISGGITSNYTLSTGEQELYEEGFYYGIIAGDTTNPADGGEVVGIIVVYSEDRRYDDVRAQETGGFIAYR